MEYTSLLAVYTRKAMMKIGLRPYRSDNGPHKSGPTQYPATNKDIVNVPTSPEILNCRISCGTIPEGAALANVLWMHQNLSKNPDKGTNELRTSNPASIVMYPLLSEDQF